MGAETTSNTIPTINRVKYCDSLDIAIPRIMKTVPKERHSKVDMKNDQRMHLGLEPGGGSCI